MELFAARRRRVLETFDGVALLPAAPVAIRNNDVEHEYRQDSDLYYFTGFDEPESLLLLSTVHSEHRAVLFVRSRDPEREIWDGARAGVDGAVEHFGADVAYPIGELRERLPEYLAGADKLYYEVGRQAELDSVVLDGIDRARARGRAKKRWPQQILHPDSLWREMRLLKDESEITAMRQAAAITAEAHRLAMGLTAPGKYEYEIEATIREVFRRRGAKRAAYTPIVGSGKNATVLHYVANDRQMEADELLLIDAGGEFEYYAADVTRTLPVSGTYTKAQREVYEVVLASQIAGIEATRPGSSIDKIHEVVVRELVSGMVHLGMLEGEVDALIEDESYKRYYMHRTSHWLGMDVHDVGAYYIDGEPRPLQAGMVLTIEPGIYVAADDEQAPEAYRGIGVRIEDDILVTEDGYENLTAAIPKTVEEVERACGA